jgi:zinc protease
MVRERELASEVRGFVSPFIDAGLFEIFVNARGGVDAMQALAAIDDELEQVRTSGIQQDELERARARIELGLLQGLSSNEGKASTMGFYEVVLDDPSAGFNRLEALGQIGVLELQAVAQRYLKNESRTVVSVRPQAQQPQSQENP